MSTPLAHLAAGTAIYFSYSRLRSPYTAWALPCFGLLAMLPDFDYLPIWLFGIRQEPRVTHGVLFCILAGMVAWRITRHWQAKKIGARPIGLIGFILAPLSHLVLDFSVGAHSLPLFWPFPNGELMSPISLLPGVIHGCSFMNYYLWRNSILESLVLIPVLLFFVVRARHDDQEHGWDGHGGAPIVMPVRRMVAVIGALVRL
ncbi:MAG: metal-dependent hydrolase [Pseudomonadota bacterium]